ncbi:BZ3500_MvSof-1268-A1-R1_Chr4-2g07051 [Microbotryum saponariae]|uniref:Polynucleotide 5'-hydroxyl-kinase GRC3 n=1 Tax=Microbotryum saponariae TaxID=289078 RepID=A0A2X0LLV4_9BASI|nr:BZ3500_MvSof-1268-A1-R1_Chr4-2g07051 [Microbotryum saponariae]SDA06716.1 BZ3501_MvSof-1269-A2-R1_Chr4-2g06762 [Microbotryum saponariae]
MAATVVDSPSKRRRTDSTSDLSSSSTSTPVAAAPPMSAVAARRAAAQAQLDAAAAAATAAMEQPKASTSKLETSTDQSSGDDDDDDDSLPQVLSSDDDDTIGDNGQHSSSTKSARSFNGKVVPEKKKKIPKAKTATKSTRYFAAAASTSRSDDDGPAGDRGLAAKNDSKESTFVPFDPMDESADDATQNSANQVRAYRGKRRREKTSVSTCSILGHRYSELTRHRGPCVHSAFIDPLCTSSFAPELNVNVFRVSLTTEHTRADAEQALVFCLRADQMIVVHGVLMVTPIYGALAILNSSLPAPEPSSDTIDFSIAFSNSTHQPIFAPSSHPLPPMSPRPYPSRSRRPSSLLLPTGQTVDLSIFEAAFVVRDHHSGVEGIEPLLKLGGLGCAAGMWDVDHPQGPIKRTSECDGKTWKLVVEPTPSLTLIRSVDGWEATLAALGKHLDPASKRIPDAEDDDEDDEELAYAIPTPSPRLCLLVEGPKRVGKSTFSKLVLHQLLSRFMAVAYLDTDLGQPEFMPPGFVSLNIITSPQLGPNFTHLSVPMASYFIGQTSPANDPTSYLDAIHKLYQLYEHEVEYAFAEETRSTRRRGPQAQSSTSKEGTKVTDRIPLLINTHGWNKGLGLDLLSKLKMDIQPTHIFAFDRDQEDDSPTSMGAKGGPIVHRMKAAPPSPLDSKWSSSDLRVLQLISYFNAVFPSSTSDSSGSTFVASWDCVEPLVRRRPIVLDWTTSLSNITILGSEIDYDQVLYALNGSLVAIVEPDEVNDEDVTPNLSSNFPYDAHISNTYTRAHGLALVRSIDVPSKSLHLLTPIPRPQTDRIALVRGIELDIAVGLLMDPSTTGGVESGVTGVGWKDVPYLSVEGGQGGGRKKVRRNLMRRGQA